MKLLLLIPLFLVAGALYGQQEVPAAGPLDCDAAYEAVPDPVNPVTVRFEDRSTGQVTLWQWNFGDGSTTTGQNPVHTFPHGGTYYVCLTVSNSTPGAVCHDFYCTMITVHQPGMCVADFSGSSEPGDPFAVYFTDKSSGNINGWHWDFGDGTASFLSDPVHTYAGAGRYRVCLTVYNTDSLSVCNNIRCDTITVEEPATCQAAFTAVLDSMNLQPRTYRFRDQSLGQPDRFLWKFDDGSMYETRDVEHRFLSSGSHTVCLYVKKTLQGLVLSRDSLCVTLQVPDFEDIGGHLFAGKAPINNPLPTGDTGVARLYRKVGKNLKLYDTRTFTSLGYYAFPQKLAGDYIVRTSLTEGSAHYGRFLPSYYPAEPFWFQAGKIGITGGGIYNSDVHLLPLADSPAGPASLQGRVTVAGGSIDAAGLTGVTVFLFTESLEPVRFVLTGPEGGFEMTGLPYGAYRLYAEVPSWYARLTAVWLDPSVPSVDSIDLELFDHDVTSLPETAGGSARIGEPYPNPGNGPVTLPVFLRQPELLRVDLLDVAGATVWTGRFDLPAGPSNIVIPAGVPGAGLYFCVVSGQGIPPVVKKMIRY